MDSSVLLSRRIAEATPEDTIRGMFIEASLQYMARTLDPDVVQRARQETFGDQTFTALFRYPVMGLLKVIMRVVKDPTLAVDCASLMEDLGRQMTFKFLDSTMGKTMLMLGRGNPHALLANLPTATRPLTSYAERTYERLGDRSALSTFKEDLMGPSFTLGIFRQGFESMGGVQDPKLTVSVLNESGSHYSIKSEW